MQNNKIEMECHTLMFAKLGQTASTMRQHRSHSLSWWMHMVATCEHNMKVWMQNYLLLLGPLYNSHVTGTCANVFNSVQNRIVIAHQLSLLSIC